MLGLAQSQPGTSPSSILQSSTFGGFWDLVKNPKIVSEKLHLSAQRFSDVPYCPVFWVVATRGCVLSVLDQVRTKFGPWNPEYGPKRDFGKVTSFRPTIFGHPVLSRIVPYSGFQGPNLVRTWSRTLRMILDIQPKFQLGAQWSLVCSPHSQPGCI